MRFLQGFLMSTSTYLVSLVTHTASPRFCSEIDLRIGIEDGMTGRPRTDDWVVLDGRKVGAFFQRSIKTGEGHNQTRSLQPRGRPNVPRKPNSIAVFALMDELLISCHAKL